MKYNEDSFDANLPAGYDGHFDWDCFKVAGCWGDTNIEPMDFDGVVERRRHYLIFETKDEGKDIPKGQKIALDNLRNAKSFTVSTIWPKSPPFKKMEMIHHNGKTETVVGHESILKRIRDWYFYASGDINDKPFMCTLCGRPSSSEGECEICCAANKGWESVAK